MTERVCQWLADIVMGMPFIAPHDYVTLRSRYRHHRGRYGWMRSVRLGPWVVNVERNHNRGRRVRVSVYPVTSDKEPHWREMYQGRRFIRMFA